MSREAGHLSGGAPIYMRYPVRVSIVSVGIPIVAVTDEVGVSPPTTTAAGDSVGLGMDIVTYSTTQADQRGGEAAGTGLGFRSFGGLDMGRMVTVSVRPDLIIKSLMSGSGTEGVVLVERANTTADAAGLTATIVGGTATDMEGGVYWCIRGNNVGYARQLVTDSTTALTTTVPWPYTLSTSDVFLECPYSGFGTGASSIDGSTNVTLSTLFTQADASAAAGAGVEAQVFKLELNGASDSYVLWLNQFHQFNRATAP